MKNKNTSAEEPQHQDEDIRNLIYYPPPVEEKIPMYHSKFSSKVREDARKTKDCHKTFGYAEVPLDPPTNFLKKKTRIVRRPLVDKQKFIGEPKPGLPPRASCKEADKKEEKNFKKDNIVRVVRAVPKQPVAQTVDTRKGHTQILEPSGLQPKYIYSKEYGKIPKYLRKGINLGQRDKDKKDKKKKPPLRYVTEEEREEMLQGLKKNWEELQKEFQLLPMVTDTVPKIKRKTQLEKQLKDLEKDIDLIERNPIIYVACEDDNEDEVNNDNNE